MDMPAFHITYPQSTSFMGYAVVSTLYRSIMPSFSPMSIDHSTDDF